MKIKEEKEIIPQEFTEPIPQEKAPSVVVKPEVKFEKVMWKGVVPVYKCKSCGHCENKKDDIILHVVRHALEKDQAKLFEKLMKEY